MKKFITRSVGLLLAVAMLISLLPAASAAEIKRKPILVADADATYMAWKILQTLPLEGKSDKEKIRIVYDWLIKNNDRHDLGRPYHFSKEELDAKRELVEQKMIEAFSNGSCLLRNPVQSMPEEASDNFLWAMAARSDEYDFFDYQTNDLLLKGYGDCIGFAGAFIILTGLLGYECHMIHGLFINGDGSVANHAWNYLLLDGEYYWFDVRIDHAEYVRRGRIGYYYFMEPSTEKWLRQHDWNRDYSDMLYKYRHGDTQGLAATGNHFWDIGGHWAADAINKCYENQYFDGTGAGCFQPESVMTRAMLVTVLWRYEGEPLEGENNFSDVPENSWYTNAVKWASHNKIVDGIGNGRFDPDGKLTREQLATIFYRYAKSKGYSVEDSTSLDRFPDANEVGSWAKDALSWAVAMKLVGGSAENGKTYLRPQGEATRAQVAAILVRFVENVAPSVQTERPEEP